MIIKLVLVLIFIAAIVSVSVIIIKRTTATSPDLITLFPMEHYSQKMNDWINPQDPNYDKSLLSEAMQKMHFEQFYNHTFGSLSPWSPEYLSKILEQPPQTTLKKMEQSVIDELSNENKPDNKVGYGKNFRRYTEDWLNAIKDNINLEQFDHLTYQSNNRGIAIDNLSTRALPTDDVHFYHHKLAGQGYPFDNIQMSALWAGTPVYILGETRDHAWLLVITPEHIAWVKSNGIARTSTSFVEHWQQQAKKQLAAITHTKTSILNDKNKFLFSAYIGAVFPAEKLSAEKIKIQIPVADDNNQAVIYTASIAAKHAAIMPLSATPHHFANVMETLLGRSYGWNSVYFNNDCSAELKSLYTPFGIWLPRYSKDQAYAGKVIDLSSSDQKQRLEYLMQKGHPFLSMIYVDGHIFMYLGNYPNPHNPQQSMAMTYQNVWALKPKPATWRAIIGGAVFLPLLLEYPEDKRLNSQANREHFLISYLDEQSNQPEKIVNNELPPMLAIG